MIRPSKIYTIHFDQPSKIMRVHGDKIEINNQLSSVKIWINDRIIFWGNLNKISYIHIDYEDLFRI